MNTRRLTEIIHRERARILQCWRYVSAGVWRDRSNSLKVRLVKTVNLTVRSFLSSDVQSTACALSFRLLLAVVPALALLFAIGRGFGFQNILASRLFDFFPSQRKALEVSMQFVDSYLQQASEGLFVGVGVAVLLWTLVSLISAIEDAFNRIWGITKGRSLWRKITDYTAIFLILPVLMVCGTGLTAFMSASLDNLLPFLSPVMGWILDVASVLFIWLFFTGLYMLVPNTRVRFRNALPAGILAGIAYQILQILFVSGQIYVSRYNAIYGGFALLPLLMIWLQLVWLFTLSGAVLCYSAQSISTFALNEDVYGLSFNYRRRIGVGMLAVIIQRFRRGLPALNAVDFERSFGVPMRLALILLNEMEQMGLIARIVSARARSVEEVAYQPARDLSGLTVGQAVSAFRNHGVSDFLPSFSTRFAPLVSVLDQADEASVLSSPELLASLPLTDLGNKFNTK